MRLSEKIKSNPYFKVSNCTDIADLESAMDELRKLDLEFGDDNKTLLKLWAKFLDKKKKLEAKASASNLRLKKGDIVKIQNPFPDESWDDRYIVVQDSIEQYNENDQIEVELISDTFAIAPIVRIEMRDLVLA